MLRAVGRMGRRARGRGLNLHLDPLFPKTPPRGPQQTERRNARYRSITHERRSLRGAAYAAPATSAVETKFYDLPLVQSAWLWQNRLSALALASFAVLAVQGDGQTSKNVKNCRFMVKRTDSSDLTSSKAKVKKRGRGQPARTSPSTVPVEPKRQIS